MLVIWARTQDEAREFAHKARLGRGGVIFAGDKMSRSLEGLRPTAIIQLPGAGETPEGRQVKSVLQRSVYRAPSGKPVPWLNLSDVLAPAV